MNQRKSTREIRQEASPSHLMKEPTVRIQKIKRDTVKTRLILFGALALLLLVCSVFSEHLTPYDPYLQDLTNAKAAPSAEHLFGTDR